MFAFYLHGLPHWGESSECIEQRMRTHGIAHAVQMCALMDFDIPSLDHILYLFLHANEEDGIMYCKCHYGFGMSSLFFASKTMFIHNISEIVSIREAFFVVRNVC